MTGRMLDILMQEFIRNHRIIFITWLLVILFQNRHNLNKENIGIFKCYEKAQNTTI